MKQNLYANAEQQEVSVGNAGQNAAGNDKSSYLYIVSIGNFGQRMI